MFEAKIIADSLSPNGVRLTTFEATFPRAILAEVNTHRVFSRNSSSLRAIKTERLIEMVMDDPYVPVYWGSNQPGMSAGGVLAKEEQEEAEKVWLKARDAAVEGARALAAIGSHKQDANQLLAPFVWQTAVITSTEWDNFFHLRNHPAASPAFDRIAGLMRRAYESHAPRFVDFGNWHLPYVNEYEREWLTTTQQIKVSVTRCARVSYLRQNVAGDLQNELERHDKLLAEGHMSPFEHIARPIHHGRVGNFNGWLQYRKMIPYEFDILGTRQTFTVGK
jgi:thymidylate synthase ThyX